MELIERYVHQVGKKLPKKQRKDVEVELRSLLEDMVEDRAQTKVEQADEEIVLDVLMEFGSPDSVAASYRDDKQYLIGPQLLPIFKIVITVVTAVLGGLSLFGITVAAFGSDQFLQEWVTLVFKAIPNFIGSMLRILGTIVVIFAVLERVLPEESLNEEADWNPKDLPEINDPNQIDKGELVFGAIFTVILLVLLNGYPQWAGIVYFQDGDSQAIPLLSANFYNNLLPLVNLLLAVSLSIDLYKLYMGKKTTVIRWMEVGDSILTAVVAYICFSNGPIFGLHPELVAMHGWDITDPLFDGIEALIGVLNSLANVGLVLLFFGELFSIGKKLYEIVREPGSESKSELVGKLRQYSK